MTDQNQQAAEKAQVCRLTVWDWHSECSPRPRYTDGSNVEPGDSVRYRQAPGGILPPSPEWKYGEAVVSSHCSGTLDLAATDGRFYHLLGHVIERVSPPGHPTSPEAAS